LITSQTWISKGHMDTNNLKELFLFHSNISSDKYAQ